MKPLLFTHHAPDRMRERSIAAEWLERTVREPEWVEPDRRHPGVERRFRAIPEYGDRVLRVACAETQNPYPGYKCPLRPPREAPPCLT